MGRLVLLVLLLMGAAVLIGWSCRRRRGARIPLGATSDDALVEWIAELRAAPASEPPTAPIEACDPRLGGVPDPVRRTGPIGVPRSVGPISVPRSVGPVGVPRSVGPSRPGETTGPAGRQDSRRPPGAPPFVGANPPPTRHPDRADRTAVAAPADSIPAEVLRVAAIRKVRASIFTTDGSVRALGQDVSVRPLGQGVSVRALGHGAATLRADGHLSGVPVPELGTSVPGGMPSENATIRSREDSWIAVRKASAGVSPPDVVPPASRLTTTVSDGIPADVDPAPRQSSLLAGVGLTGGPAGPRAGGPTRVRGRAVRFTGRLRVLALVGLGGLAVGAVLGGPVAAVVVATYGLLGVRGLLRGRAARQADRLRRQQLDELCGLAADLRAGLPVPTPTAVPSESDGARLARLTRAAVRLADRTGAPLAELVERIEADARSTDRGLAAAAAQAAGARATAWLLAALPLGGVGLGYGIGVDPLRVLLHTPLGAAAAIAAVVLQVAGLFWTERLTGSGRGGR